MSGNTTSLYTTTGPNIVGSNNFTTLYNSSGQGILPQLPYGNSNVEAFLNNGTDGGNTVQNILANGFIHSNSYISASGNVIAGGNLIVNQNSYLGNVGNVHIDGGNYNYLLATDGAGNLSWVSQYIPTPPTPTPYIHFDVVANANNQTFSDAYINAYGSNTYINLFKNGVNIEPAYFIKTNATTVQVNIPLTIGDTIDILASDASTGSNTPPAGNLYEVQFNAGTGFGGDTQFLYYPGNNLLNVGNIQTTTLTGTTGNFTTINSNLVAGNYLSGNGYAITSINASNVLGTVADSNHALVSDSTNSIIGSNVIGYVANATHATIADTSNVTLFANTANTVVLGAQPNITSTGTLSTLTVSGVTNLNDISNVKILGGFANYVMSTDGSGNLSWVVGGGGGNGSPAGSNTYVQFNDNGAFGGDSGLTYDKSIQALGVNYIFGNGAGLTNLTGPNVTGQVSYAAVANSIAGANVTGTVANANYATYAGTAYSVSAANISGTVNLANYATVANSVAGANVSGQVAYAAIANSVAGANVSGEVSYAAVANSVAGANVTGYVANATHANIADVANSVAGANVTGSVANANYSNFSGTAYSISGSNVTGYVANATHANIADVANSVAAANVTGLGNIAVLNIDGSSSNVLYGNGVFAGIGISSNANYANYAGNAFSVTGSNVTGQVGNALVAGTVYTGAQPNITSVGTLSSLSVTSTTSLQFVDAINLSLSGNFTLQRAFEVFTPNGTGGTGTVNFDALSQSILYKTANATGNVTLNIRGNNITTLDFILPTNDSLTVVYLNNVGATAYIVTQVQIDGVNVTPKYVNGATPSTGTRLTNATQSYTYSILKTAANTYTVLGSLTEYQ